MKNSKRVWAIIGIIGLLLLYLLLFLFAFGKSENSQSMFRALLATVFILPVLLYAFLIVARVLRPRKASPVKTLLISPSLAADEALSAYLDELRSRGFSCLYDEDFSTQEVASCVLISDNEDTAARAKKAGIPALLFDNLDHLKEQLASIAVE